MAMKKRALAMASSSSSSSSSSESSPSSLPPPASNSTFSVAVIGLGLIGSAACRHLSLAYGSSLLAIGPPEPSHWHSHPGPFSSHYDQGRLTRIVDPDPVWSKLAARSIARYASLQEESGIRFHEPVGSLRVTPFYNKPEDSLERSFEIGKQNGAVAEIVQSSDTLQTSFPILKFHSSDVAIMERGGAGYINPRALISAQLALAAQYGACILEETVTKIMPGDKGVQILTDKGRTLLAQKALVCAGSYSGFLLPEQSLDLRTKAVSVVLAEVGLDEQQRLQGMPSFIWRLRSHTFLHSVYCCPPLLYPDGKVHLKIGGTAWEPIYLSSYEEMMDWFHGDGNPEETGALLDVLDELLLGLRITSVSCKPCMVSYTAHDHPYIDAVDGKPIGQARIFVAAGGCGASAKSSDEIGRIAALLVQNGKWTYDLDASIFRAVFTKNTAEAKLSAKL